MRTPLLSFLTDFEAALAADAPYPEDGSWSTSRSVNYAMGLARLELRVKVDRVEKPRGHLLLQGYQLADGTPCLKAQLAWAGSDATREFSLFSKPNFNWHSEARKLAAEWMAGAPALADAIALNSAEESILEESRSGTIG